MDDASGFLQASDGTPLAMACHPAAGDGPAALVLHGIASHMGWYRGLAERLAGMGVTTYLLDRRGAGRSAGERGHTPSWKILVGDALHAGAEIRRRHPGSAVHLVGISLGGVQALATALRRPGTFGRIVLFSPALASTVSVPLLRRLRLARRSLTNPKKLYDLPITVEMLTDRLSWRREIEADPLRTRRVTARFLVEFFRMQGFVRRSTGRLEAPVRCLLAGRDAVIDNARVLAILRNARSASVSVQVFEEAQHVLPASVPPEEILARVGPWLREGGAPPPGFSVIRAPGRPGEGHAWPEPPPLARGAP